VRRLVLLLAFAVLAGCGEDGTPAAGGDGELARLVIRVDSDGEGGAPARELRLTCAAPTDSQACGAAAGISGAELAPTPDGTACTQIFGGPETASIRGTLHGEEVDATFSRRDGCEIKRWDGVAPLLAEVR
jgi:hypothetical protein